ncbi:Oidioi.mRNA.OKI2018_I69.chr2.g4131.t1.cds [Oikopleura dioica]|uniref:Oidioi.mRNA.OKI2018_I69.chr2.g4131.t1.cds n=1 Tax=Oikopleura dioica TaxID=34765 RepID=A0ABN7SXY8_OIKDI|nr:Oidioi.mRNA.OKI2018_I69.chr2.g4131.t1.cds [Oikopleura dioica]
MSQDFHIGIKSHNTHHVSRCHAAVLVIRNPYDTLKAEFNRRISQMKTGNGQAAHTDTIDPEYFRSDKWRRYVRGTSKTWSNFYKGAITGLKNQGKGFHLLFHDLLKTQKVEEMRKLYDFLEEEASEDFKVDNVEERLNCIENQKLDKYKRKNQEFDFDLFLPDEIKAINELVEGYKEFFKNNSIEFPEETVHNWLK